MKSWFLRRTQASLLMLTATVACFSSATALATDLPPGVVNYLRQLDEKVQVRFDGLATLSNGESYLPVIPQDPEHQRDATKVAQTWPANAKTPDIIQFDNNFFLIRLVQTSSGRLTLAQADNYPIQMREGLFPQDLVLPNNLFIPSELKILLGELPYNPQFDPKKDNSVSKSIQSSQPQPQQTVTAPAPKATTPKSLYVFSPTDQALIGIQPDSGKKTGSMTLQCIPSKLMANGNLLFAPCLTSNELLVIDLTAHLIKTRVPVGSKPNDMAFYNDQVLVSNRYSNFLNRVNMQDLVSADQIALPGPGGAIALLPEARTAFVADAFAGKIYQVDLAAGRVVKTFTSQPDISALTVTRGSNGPVLWVASRSAGNVQAINPVSLHVLNTFEVGKKPVDMTLYQDKLFVVSANDSRVDIINTQTHTLGSPIKLPGGSFPSAIVASQEEGRAFVTGASANEVYVLNLKHDFVEKTHPLGYRTLALALSGEPPLPTPQPPAVEAATPTQPEKPAEQTAAEPKTPSKKRSLFKRDKKQAPEATPPAETVKELPTPNAAPLEATPKQSAQTKPQPGKVDALLSPEDNVVK